MAKLGTASLSRLTWRRALTFASVGLLLVIAIGIGWQIVTARAQLDVVTEVERQQGAITRQTDTLLQAMVDSESGMRGFVITGRESYLAPFEEGSGAAAHAVEALEKLIPANSALRVDYERVAQ